MFQALGKMGDTPSSKRLLRGVILAAFFAGFIGLFLPLGGYSNGRFGYGGLGEGQAFVFRVGHQLIFLKSEIELPEVLLLCFF